MLYTLPEANICDSIDRLNAGIGFDYIHSNHLKFAGKYFHVFLSRLFTSFLCHSFLPYDMLRGEIRPIIKKANGNRNVSSNYRPVMNSSNFLKLFEYSILSLIENFIEPNVHQFGFRKHTSCLNAITILKETVQNYNSSGSKVHCAMVDLSNAFDKMNHQI